MEDTNLRKIYRQNSSFYGDLVQYYEYFYLSKKNIEDEVAYIMNYLKKIDSLKNVLDIGCGTGYHDWLLASKYNFNVKGIDISPDMVAYAQKYHNGVKNTYECCSAQSFQEFKKYQACISLAHVIGYQYDNDALDAMLDRIYENLNDTGLFLFNFYNMAGVMNSSLKPRKQEKEFETGRILRFSNAETDFVSNSLQLYYYYIIDDNDEREEIEIREKMRFYSDQEMLYHLQRAGFGEISFFNWRQEDNQEIRWNRGCICRKCEKGKNK